MTIQYATVFSSFSVQCIRKGRYLSVLLGCCLSLLACSQDSDQDKAYEPRYAATSALEVPSEAVYDFGIHPLHNPQRLFEVYQPLMDFLELVLAGKGLNAKFQLQASRDYPSYDRKLFSRAFHFSLPNPYQTVQSTKHGYRIFGKMGDDENFRGIILVRKDSGIEYVTDLQNQAISYPAPTALAATMMPQWYLYQQGLNVMEVTESLYVGSQESSIMNVYLGHSKAGATWPPPWRAFSKERPEVAEALEVRWETPSLPNNGLVVRDDVPEIVVEAVSQVLFSLHEHEAGRTLLSAMELSRFEAADDHTYQAVRAFLQRFAQELRPIEG